MPTESASQALSILRDGSQFQWYVIPLFALAVYVYATEVERRNLVTTFTKVALELKDSVPHRLPEVHVEAMQPEITAQQREGIGACHTQRNCR
jgi:hypothetical protein